VGLGAALVVALVVAAALAVPRSDDVRTVRVALVQGGGPQRTRATDTSAQDVFDRHVAASEGIDGPVDLVVWPENVVNIDGPLAGTAAGGTLSDLARKLGAPILAGVVEDVGTSRFTNYAVVVNPDGTFGDRYDKVLRVPFGEYVPFRAFLNALSGGAPDRFVPRDAIAGDRPAVVRTPAGPVGVVISWEIFFERRVRDAVHHGGELITNPTNGSSYWLTIVQSQQVASSRLRALASDRWVLQSAPTGFSAVVDPDGEVRQRTGVSEQRVLEAEVTMRQGLSPAMRYGPLPWAGIALALVGAGWSVERRRRRPTSGTVRTPSPAGS
jgi:apolipoprotein N-acyltransferase